MTIADQEQEQDKQINAGSRWVLRRGQHAGSVVQIEGRSFAGSVKYRNLGGGQSVGSSSWDDVGRMHTLRRVEFLTLYEPESKATGDGVQAAFRQKNAKKTPGQNGTPLTPAEGLQVSLESITPVLAREWLERGGVNRHIVPRRVRKLTAAICRGEWRVTGETIKLDAEGNIRDGQHRLAAIYEAGISVQSLVVRNVKEDAFDVMDTGKSRQLPDVLGIHRYPDVNALAAAIRNLLVFDHHGRFSMNTRESESLVTTATALEYIRAHPEVLDALREAEVVRKFLAGGTGIWTALLTLFARVDVDLEKQFHAQLVSGEKLDRSNPVLVVRNHLMVEQRRFITRTAQQKEELAAAVIKAWNAYRRGKTINNWTDLQWRRSGRRAEPFPRPDDRDQLL